MVDPDVDGVEITILMNYVALHNAHLAGDYQDALVAVQEVINSATRYQELIREHLREGGQPWTPRLL